MPAVKIRRGERVAEARHTKGLTQHQLADKLGVSRSAIARLELGSTTPTLDLAMALAAELGESVEALFGGER